MRVIVSAVLAVTVGSGCVATSMPATRDLMSTPRREAAWIIAAGVGEIVVGSALVYASVHSSPQPDEDPPLGGGAQVTEGLSDAGSEFAGMLIGILVGTGLALSGAADLPAGLYQLGSDDYLFGGPDQSF